MYFDLTDCLLPPPPTLPGPSILFLSWLHGLFVTINRPSSPVSAAHMCTRVGPPTVAWATSAAHTQRKVAWWGLWSLSPAYWN